MGQLTGKQKLFSQHNTKIAISHRMKIAITGCNGRIGRRVVLKALEQEQHTVVGIDIDSAALHDDHLQYAHARFTFVQVDLRDYGKTYAALEGCEGVVSLAGIPDPGDYVAETHNT